MPHAPALLQSLLREFPEHAILEQLLLVSQRLMSLPLDSPLGRLLAGAFCDGDGDGKYQI